MLNPFAFLARLARPTETGPTETPAAAPAAAGEAKALTGLVGLPLAAGQPAESGYFTLAREGYMKNPVAHRSIRLVAEAAASVPWTIAVDGRTLDSHPALDLVRQPQRLVTGIAFFEALYSQLMIGGNAFVAPVMAGPRIAELHLLRPDRVKVTTGRDGWPESYDYRAGGRLTRYEAGGRPPGLLHLKAFHPLDDHGGLASLEAARSALDLANAATAWNKALIDNSARPSGALVYQPGHGGNLSAEQFDRLKAELAEGYSGPARAGRPMLLEGGLDWKSMGLSPREMDFAEARNGAAREVALALGVPPMLIGIPGDNTYANYQEANRAFFRLTVLPLLARTAAAFSAFLERPGEGRITLGHDLDQVAGLVAERDQLWARVNAASFLSEDEKRVAVGWQAGPS